MRIRSTWAVISEVRAKEDPGVASNWAYACETSASGIISLPMRGYSATPTRMTATAPANTTNRLRMDQARLSR